MNSNEQGSQKQTDAVAGVKRKRVKRLKDFNAVPGYEWITPQMLRKWKHFSETPRINSRGDEMPLHESGKFGVFFHIGRSVWVNLDALDAYINHLTLSGKGVGDE